MTPSSPLLPPVPVASDIALQEASTMRDASVRQFFKVMTGMSLGHVEKGVGDAIACVSDEVGGCVQHFRSVQEILTAGGVIHRRAVQVGLGEGLGQKQEFNGAC